MVDGQTSQQVGVGARYQNRRSFIYAKPLQAGCAPTGSREIRNPGDRRVAIIWVDENRKTGAIYFP